MIVDKLKSFAINDVKYARITYEDGDVAIYSVSHSRDFTEFITSKTPALFKYVFYKPPCETTKKIKKMELLGNDNEVFVFIEYSDCPSDTIGIYIYVGGEQ